MSDVAIDVNHTSDISDTSDMVFRSVDTSAIGWGVSLNEETANLINTRRLSPPPRGHDGAGRIAGHDHQRMGRVGR
jgi:hypothetical protein